MNAQRADARRNYAHILSVAEAEVAALGSQISLERIARLAGVGSGTVRRHFPDKHTLLQAVFDDRVTALCAQAPEMADSLAPGPALHAWLHAFAEYGATSRGMADTLVVHKSTATEAGHACAARLIAAAEPLLQRAIEAGATPPQVRALDLLTLVSGIVLATEEMVDPADEAARILDLALAGIYPAAGTT